MPSIVFMRAVNVGKHQRCSVSALAKEMRDFDVVNIGAVGTLVVRAKISRAALRNEIWRHMPFKAEVMICDARDILSILRDEAQPPVPVDGIAVERFLTVLANRPLKVPRLPIVHPAGEAWQVKVVRVVGCLVVSHWRRAGKRLIYPNEVVETHFDMPATTRNWNTVEKIGAVLSQRGA